LPAVPPEAIFKGYEDFVVQDLVLQPRVVRYRRERWLTREGQDLVAPLPADVVPGSHYGPDLICFILHQYHHQHVTQPLLLEQLRQLGIDISAGELSRILTEGKDAFHQEKAELLPAALAVSAYVQVDDTGARHQGHNGSCTHIGNELFASFASTESKSRLNFLELLRRPHTDYVINEIAVGGREAVNLDFAIPRSYGLRQTIADTLGIGGIFRALRTIPVMIGIGQDMAELCPDALLLNYTNPMSMIPWSVYAGTPTSKVVGLCHSIRDTQSTLAGLVGVPEEEISFVTAGVNHQAFVLRFERGGEDLYPRLAAVVEADPPVDPKVDRIVTRKYLARTAGNLHS